MLCQIPADFDILSYRKIRHEVIELEDESELVAPILGEFIRGETDNFITLNLNRTGIGKIETSYAVEKG